MARINPNHIQSLPNGIGVAVGETLRRAADRLQAGSVTALAANTAQSTNRSTAPRVPISSSVRPSMVALDPEALLRSIQSAMRSQNTEQQQDGVELSADRAEAAEAKQVELLAKAAEAAEEAGGFLGLGNITNVIASVAAVVAGVASAVVTGGAGLALAVVGVALMLGGDEIGNALVEADLVSPEVGMAISIGCKIAGAACTLGSGALGGAATVGSSLAQGLATAADYVNLAASVVTAATGLVGGYFQFEAANFNLDADEQVLIGEQAHDRMDQWIEEIESTEQQHGRMMRRFSAILDSRMQARNTAAQAVGA